MLRTWADQVHRVVVAAVWVAVLVPTTASAAVPIGTLVEGMHCTTDASQTYTLYLPSSYTTERRSPVLLIFDPRGRSRAAAELFREPAERFGWILLSSNDTRSDGPMEPNIKAVNALWPEALYAYASDPRRISCAGFSGGSTVALLVGSQLPIAGIIASGGPYAVDLVPAKPGYAWFGAAGDIGFNNLPMRRLDALYGERGAPHRFVEFDGEHQWMPAELAAQGVAWLEAEAMRAGTRPRNEALAQELAAADVAAARKLEDAGRPLDAMRRWEAVVRTFDGLVDVSAAREAAARLARDPRVKGAEKAERRADRDEQAYDAVLTRGFAELRNTDRPMPAARLASMLQIERLLAEAKGTDADALSARRRLASAFVNLWFYIPRELVEAKLYARAATSLEIAARIQPKRPALWYNLACARSQANDRSSALDALAKAIDLGFADAHLIATDADLDSLRNDPRFAEIARRAGPPPAAGANVRK